MHVNLTRRGFVFGSAAAAVMAGLAGLATTGCSNDAGAAKQESVAVATQPVTENVFYESAYEFTKEAEQQLVADQLSLGTRAVNEGIVLLKNEGAALPLSPDEGKVTCFGNATTYMTGFDAAMKDAGFTFDDDSWAFFAEGTQNVNSWQVNENPWKDIEAAPFMQSVGGVALVFLARRDQEGCDAQWHADHDYLALSDEEKDLLNGVAELRRQGTFSKMIVLVSTSNNISWEDGPWSDAVDALLWFGNITATGYSLPLVYGSAALVDVLDGTVSPSGRLADTVYKNNQVIPAMVNFGQIDADLSKLSTGKDEEVQALSDEWKPSNDSGNHWRHNYVYAEGIYVGYRYPETRYEDKVLGQGNAGDFDYSSVVAYPFGAGLSYTSFEYSDFKVEEGTDAFTVSVNVTNAGQVAGKHAVTVYVQSPYTDYDRANHVEKASVELKGYEKTAELAPGASEQLSISVSKRELASFDAEGAKTFILDDGDYYFTIAESAHDAVNNILAAKGKTTADGMTADGSDTLVWVWSNPDFDDTTFATSVAGTAVTTLFDEVDPNKNELIRDENSVTWLSRSDWEGTFPKKPVSLVYTDALADLAKPIAYEAGSGDQSSVPTHEFGKSGDVKLVDLHGKDYDDAEWDKLVSQLTYEEAVDLAAYSVNAIEKIGKPYTAAGNGSQGWTPTFVVSGLTGAQLPSKDVLASTFSTEINELAGAMVAENMLHGSTTDNKKTSLWGWSCNVHRTPYSGRNFEYFSEDPYLGGRACAEETRGVVDRGGLVYTKHIAGNDQEEYRHGVPSWADEQTLREIYLRQFEKAVVDGHANGVMTGFHRLGIRWTGENSALLKGWLEGELGYRGITLTDQFEADYMDAVDGILNGTHAWLGAQSDRGGNKVCRAVLLQDDYKNDKLIQDGVYEAAHRILYNFANSLAVNGLTHDHVAASDNPLATAVSDGAAASFYGDKNFTAIQSGFFSDTWIVGTWDYAEDGALTLNVDGGDAITATPDANGIITWEFPGGMAPIVNSISQYELATAYNAAFGTKYATGENPSFHVSFSAGEAAASGSDPSAMEFHRGDALTLPECPYEAENLVFAGWSIGGATYPAGEEFAAESYADLAAEATWTALVLATAKTKDGYRHTWKQDAGIPLALYADGTAELDRYKGYTFAGTWELAGSGSGEGTLTILNEAGQAVAAKADGGELVYEQEGYVYDWHQPDQGFGTGVLKTSLKHVIDLDEFMSAYNEAMGTSYTSIKVAGGSASFAEQESGEPKSVF